MKLFAVLVLFGGLAATVPMPSEDVIKSQLQAQPEEQNQDTLASVDANPHSDNVNADRSKRFLFFFKLFNPYPVTYKRVSYTPVVTPIVTKTKVVAAPVVKPAPVAYTYKVKPVTYRYTYSGGGFFLVKSNSSFLLSNNRIFSSSAAIYHCESSTDC